MPRGENTRRAREEREARALEAFTAFMGALDAPDRATVAFIDDLAAYLDKKEDGAS